MNRKDWQRAFGEVPEDFTLHLRSTLDGLEEYNMKKRYKLSTVLLAAALCVLLLAGAGIAATRLGVFDVFGDIVPLPGAEEMVGTNLGFVENELASLTVEEAVYDGQGALLKLRFAPKDGEKYVMFNSLWSGAPEEEYYIISRPVLVSEGTQTRIEDGVETKLINNYGEQRITVNGEEVPIPESEQEALDKGLPAYREEGKLYYSQQHEREILGRKDGRGLIGFWVTVEDEAGLAEIGPSQTESQEDGSVVLWVSGAADEYHQQDSLTLKISGQTFDTDERQVPMDAIEITLPKTVEERRVRVVPVGDGKIPGLQFHEGEATFTRVRGYIRMAYSYDPAQEDYDRITLSYYTTDGVLIPGGSGSGTSGYGEGSWTYEIQSFEPLPESIWVEAQIAGGEVLGRIECRLIEDAEGTPGVAQTSQGDVGPKATPIPNPFN